MVPPHVSAAGGAETPPAFLHRCRPCPAINPTYVCVSRSSPTRTTRVRRSRALSQRQRRRAGGSPARSTRALRRRADGRTCGSSACRRRCAVASARCPTASPATLIPVGVRLDALAGKLDRVGEAARYATSTGSSGTTAITGENDPGVRPSPERADDRRTVPCSTRRRPGAVARRTGRPSRPPHWGRRGSDPLNDDRVARARLEGERQALARRARDLGGTFTGSRTLAEDAAGRRVRGA